VEKAVGLEDILIIAPYNAQVFDLKDRFAAWTAATDGVRKASRSHVSDSPMLGEGRDTRIARPDGECARIGTVDKFQGQEAPIVIYSMTTSTHADAPRGMGFPYSLNRLNVATSRAKCQTFLRHS
jgi:uncharacterized protein